MPSPAFTYCPVSRALKQVAARRFVLKLTAGALCMLWVFALISCGRKALPTPADAAAPPMVKTLQASLEGDVLKLTWTVSASEKGDPLTGFRIYRYSEEGASSVCADCPRQFVLAAEVDLGSAVAGEQMVYRETIPAGRRCLYRISCMTEDGAEGEKSVPVTVDRGVVSQ